VAVTSLAPARSASRSTVALKVITALSGLILIGYLLLHMYGNLKVFEGQAKFDEYAHHLRIIGEPILPYSGLLWVVRVVLLVSVIAHIYATMTLWRRARAARGGTKRYYSNKGRTGVQRSYASFTLRWGGLTIALFVIYHLLHLTWNVVAPGGATDSPYQRLVNGFQIWWVLLSYVVAMIAVCLHLRHGTYSALTTLGANTSVKARHRLNLLAYAVAAVITVGFLLPPLAIFFRLVGS
jgi:succinate dehydrogenase / fumarate reductase, cytochrome b subunit